MSPEQISGPKKISEVILLVHPLYSILGERRYYTPPFGVGDYYTPSFGVGEPEGSAEVRKNAKVMLGAWGNEIKKASENPNSILIILSPITFRELTRTHSAWTRNKFVRLVVFAKRKLGDRLFFEQEPVSKMLEEKLGKRGFVIDRKALRGKSFGQYFDHCVKDQRRALARLFKVPEGSISKARQLSLEDGFRGARKEFKWMRKERRKTARRLGAVRRI